MNPADVGRTKAEPRSNAKVYWLKAMRFAHAARTNAGEGDWDPAVANAIQAVINCVDAVFVHYRGVRSSSGSHRDALNVLDGCAELGSAARNGLRKHLGALLSQKTFAQYEGRLLDREEAEAALAHLERAIASVKRVAQANRWVA